MRLWSIHPKYLDASGLVALWREALLGQAVLAGRTRGYTHHPQLVRFREQASPEAAIAKYLREVADEADRRGYGFARDKIGSRPSRSLIPVTTGQIAFEWTHLLAKLRRRSPDWYRRVLSSDRPQAHPMFVVIDGDAADWERAVTKR